MIDGDVRRGATNAAFNKGSASIITGELLILSIAAGAYFKSWYVFGGCVLGFSVAMVIPYLNVLLAITLSLIWCAIGFGIGKLFSEHASYVLGGIGLLAGLGAHISAFQWFSDLGERPEKPVQSAASASAPE